MGKNTLSRNAEIAERKQYVWINARFTDTTLVSQLNTVSGNFFPVVLFFPGMMSNKVEGCLTEG